MIWSEGTLTMINENQIGWSAYDIYEGPFFRGTARYSMPQNPSFNDQILAVITATEGGAWNAINMYDRCICTVGLIQWCEGGQYSVSDMLGLAFERNPSILSPLGLIMSQTGVQFRRNAKGRFRFHFNDARGEVDRSEEQKQLFLLDSSGQKGAWNPSSKTHAKRWAAALASVYEQPQAIEAQRDFTVPRLYQFALPFAKSWLDKPESRATNFGQAFTCAFLSFAANNPTRANNALQDAVANWSDDAFTAPWLEHVLERLTFHSGVSIYPHRYNAIRPVLERLFGVDLPDKSEQLSGLLGPDEIQEILVHKLGYDLGKSGANADGVDGAWGKKSIAALADFERRRGFPSDGLPDRNTNDALLKARDAA